MIRAFPYVPLGVQMRIGVAIFSYNGEVSFGVTGDYDSTEDLDVLCQGIEEGIRQMRKTASRGDQPAASSRNPGQDGPIRSRANWAGRS
jgi:hypothetical protein